MLGSEAANIFLIVASVCIVLVTLMAAAVTVGVLLAMRSVLRVTRRAKGAFDQFERIEHRLVREGVFALKWIKFFSRSITRSSD